MIDWSSCTAAMVRPLFSVERRSYRNIGLALVVLCALCIVGAWSAEQVSPIVVLALFGLAGLYMVLGAGRFDFDADGIRHQSQLGAWAIRWDDITHVEISEIDGTLVLAGGNKRFILSPAAWWTGSDSGSALEFVVQQLERRNLPPRPSRTATYKMMKNTRAASSLEDSA